VSVVAAPYLTEVSGAGVLQWRDVVSRLLVDIEMAGAGAQSFEGHLQCRSVMGIRFADVMASPNFSRSVERASVDRPAFLLCYQLSGSGSIRQDGREAELRTGDLAIYTTARDSEVAAGHDFRALSLRVPMDLVKLPTVRVDALMAKVLPQEQGFGPVMGGYLERIAPLLDTGSPSARLQATRTGVEMFTTLVRFSLDERDALDEGRHDTQLPIQIVEHIEANLADPRLSPATIAMSLHISLRQVHKLFTAGDTVAAYIRRRRLQMCEGDLADPARREEPVATIARRWGLESASHFGQLFREHTGKSPASYRRDLLSPTV